MKFKLIIFIVLLSAGWNCIASHLASNSWMDIEYLYWWPQNSPMGVPLATKNDNPAALGVIGEPGTQIVLGKGSNTNSFNFGGVRGARVSIGSWIDEQCRYGIEAVGFGFPETRSSYSVSSLTGNPPVVNVPFFDLRTFQEDVVVNRHPNTVSISDEMRIWGAELNGMYRFMESSSAHGVFLLGVRHLNIGENFRLNDAAYEIPAFPNSVVNVRDKFETKNYLYGIQPGANLSGRWNKLMLNATGLLAFGNNYQTLKISGETNVNNNRVLQPIGIFSEYTNIGSYHRNRFAIVPELRAKLGFILNQYISPFLSYNCFYINNVLRPANQINRNINLTQNPAFGGNGLVGVPLPAPLFKTNGMWVQGVGLGIEFTA